MFPIQITTKYHDVHFLTFVATRKCQLVYFAYREYIVGWSSELCN